MFREQILSERLGVVRVESREEQRIYCLSNFIIFIETISCRVLRHNIRLILSLDQQTKLILECFSKNNYQARSKHI